ncbi:hypothetical protein MOBT1_001845 [Malassezia obtusa]|uniref:RlpA-like protein double-psi beta-barrel domain-containing protein n=1 Tax=Malassezia obtusa TaxID=76774 RepID=A0AAF0IWL4_9BASI|nr:hypothetical protein MOBT1_001845 [Malassezia obtusa]
MKFAIFALFALVALATVIKAEEKFLDDDGKEIELFDSQVGDDDFEDDVAEKRSLNIRGKSPYGLGARHNSQKVVTSGPEQGDELREDRVRITWYAAHDLKNPACGDETWNPKNSNHIGAVKKTWTNGPQCGQFVRLCNEHTSKCLRIRVVDECEGCSANHVDLTKSAFKKLSTTNTLDEGLTNGLKLYMSKKPNPWDFALYGPIKLRA